MFQQSSNKEGFSLGFKLVILQPEHQCRIGCRAFMKERLLGEGGCGESLLYFGCRRRDQDYLYGSLLESWHEDNSIQLHTAFSREQVDPFLGSLGLAMR
jgi:hypothetical protein